MPDIKTSAPVNFVYRTAFDVSAALAAADIEHHIAQDAERRCLFAGTRADLNMIALTFLHLRSAGYGNITLSRHPAAGLINVVHSHHLRAFGHDPRRFDVCIRGDYPARPWAQFHIVQNEDQLGGPNSAVLRLWPQPRIVPRNATRTAFQRIGYLGQLEKNLAGDAAFWRALLAPQGFAFVVKDADAWHDYDDLDAVIAIRRFGRHRFSDKPPSKLINAWIAGVPFIGGSDSAYEQVGTLDTDYLLATTPDGVLVALQSLRDDEGLRTRLVANGRRKAQAFSREAIINHWVDVLEGAVEQRYRAWSRRPGQERLRSKALALGDWMYDSAKAGARKVRLHK